LTSSTPRVSETKLAEFSTPFSVAYTGLHIYPGAYLDAD
jgi:hypothetical protein